MNKEAPEGLAWDVVIIGGALSGAATAHLLLQDQPGLRILILEKSTAFSRRVGEATVEVSAYFLSRTLGLMQYLNEHHLVKQGFRFWFANDRARSLEQCGEIGGRYLARVPAFQLDRATFDEEVLCRARQLGAQLWRPAVAQKVELAAGGQQTVYVRHAEQTKTVRTRWVVDASGVAALLARQNGWWRPNLEHPTAAVWSRWRGVKDLDGAELAAKYPKWAEACYGIRATATNHLMGAGWWAWLIPLKGGDVSVGVVFDQRLVTWPEQGSLGDRLKEFLCAHPAGRELLSEAQWLEGDVHWRRNLPYYSTTHAGDGFVLVGDAAGFLDPFYSPGMDWISYTTSCASQLIQAQHRGEPVAPLVARHNQAFSRSYQRWFRALYKDKYEYMGDYELMRLVFLMDLGFYYLGVAAQPYLRGREALRESVFTTGPSVPVYHLMRFYNRRFARMARARRARGVWGRRNHDRRWLFGGYTFSGTSAAPIVKALLSWVGLELTEGWRSWLAREPAPERVSTGVSVPTALPTQAS